MKYHPGPAGTLIAALLVLLASQPAVARTVRVDATGPYGDACGVGDWTALTTQNNPFGTIANVNPGSFVAPVQYCAITGGGLGVDSPLSGYSTVNAAILADFYAPGDTGPTGTPTYQAIIWQLGQGSIVDSLGHTDNLAGDDELELNNWCNGQATTPNPVPTITLGTKQYSGGCASITQDIVFSAQSGAIVGYVDDSPNGTGLFTLNGTLPADWAAQAAAGVPEPAALALLAFVFPGLMLARGGPRFGRRRER